MRALFALFALFASLTLPLTGWSAVESERPEQNVARLTDLTLEELIDIEITSVSKQPEKLGAAAAAIFVITAEDIRRSGVTSIPEALRLAPNLQVARVDSSQYAISARGFNSTTANKLLVLLDGRSVYTPLYSGVFWDAQDTLLEDIERIEVISGSGATLWGSNAVNGVINIITRSAHDTAGALLSGGGGTQERAFAGLRYGGKLSEDASYRVYGKYFDRDNTTLASGAPVADAWHKGQAGFRVDWAQHADTVTLQGDTYRGSIDQALFDDKTIEGTNVLARWGRALANDAHWQLQLYYDYVKRDYPATFGETRNTFDAEMQHAFKLAEHNRLIWGMSYRSSSDHIRNSANLAFVPADRTLDLASVFFEDHSSLLDDRLQLTLGSRWEHNDFTGMEVQPGARASWTFHEHHVLWGAVSRAVRTPSRVDRDLFAPATPPFILAGGPGFQSEKLNAYEIGYRTTPRPRTSLAISAFYNDYKNLRTLEPVTGTRAFVLGNGMAGHTYGFEIWGEAALAPAWRVKGGYAFLEEDLRLVAGSADPTGVTGAGNDARHRFVVLSTIDVSPTVALDTTLSYVSALPAPAVPAYTLLNVRLGWKATRQIELSLIGQNLLDKRHPEFGQPATRSELQRGVLAKAVWSF